MHKVQRDDKGCKPLASLESNNPTGSFKTTKKRLQWVTKSKDIVEMHEFGYLLNAPKIRKDDDDNIVDAEGNPAKFEDYLNPVEKTHAVSRLIGEASLRLTSADDVLQLERIGYFRCDKASTGSAPLVLFMIPDGKEKAMSSRTSKLAHA